MVRECAAAGAAGVIIISAGGKEVGEEGKAIEMAIEEEARKWGIRIIGPNCVGVVNVRAVLLWAGHLPPPPHKVIQKLHKKLFKR